MNVWPVSYTHLDVYKRQYKKGNVASITLQPPFIIPGFCEYTFPQAESSWRQKTHLERMLRPGIVPCTTRLVVKCHTHWSVFQYSKIYITQKTLKNDIEYTRHTVLAIVLAGQLLFISIRFDQKVRAILQFSPLQVSDWKTVFMWCCGTYLSLIHI